MRYVSQKDGHYVACIISRSGKNEIRFYELKEVNEEVNSTIKGSVFVEDEIVDAVWTSTDLQVSKKKRSLNGSQKETSNYDVLVVVLGNGELLSLSPSSSTVISKVSLDDKINKLIKAHQDSIWALTADGKHVIKYSMRDQSVVKKYQLPASVNTVEILTGTKLRGKSQYLALAASNILIGKLSKNKFVKDNEFKLESSGKISSIIQLEQSSDLIAFVSNSKELYVVDVSKGNKARKVPCDHPIDNISTLTFENKEYIVIKTNECIQLIDVEEEEEEVVKSITANDTISGVISVDGLRLVGIFKRGNDLAAVGIDWESSDKSIVLNIEGTSSNQNESLSKTKIFVPEAEETRDIEADEALEKLLSILGEKEINKQAVANVCATTKNADTIKEVVKNLATGENKVSGCIEKLYAVANEEVAKDASSSESFGIWLKWILLTYGGAIAKQSNELDNLRNLQNQLSQGLKILPNLIAIQGRLQLLKLQAEVRENQISNQDGESNENKDQEEDIIYANGEGDDIIFTEPTEEVIQDIEDI
ncbi:UTP9 [[Candida] subhashii]|uniref:UTP9 n=1 Tax=[Candida] subhashii TaxID=561895 RepID=A0A8J5QFU3_9ASCO|nr:UTP9 [[Candida] subhashii]KAG7661239.1 UTP9 [[Candida] subhashii]